MEVAAAVLGVRLLAVNASYPSEFEQAFETLLREHAGALLVGGDGLFFTYLDQIVALAALRILDDGTALNERPRGPGSCKGVLIASTLSGKRVFADRLSGTLRLDEAANVRSAPSAVASKNR